MDKIECIHCGEKDPAQFDDPDRDNVCIICDEINREIQREEDEREEGITL